MVPHELVMGWFTTPTALLHAIEALRAAGYRRIDTHTPFPVHGLDRVLGIRPTPLPKFVLAAGVSGLFGSIALAWFTQGYDYPLLISGKPAFSFQAFVPVFFEVTVLAAGLTCFFSLWLLTGLPRLAHPSFGHRSFARASDDVFFISVDTRDPQHRPEVTAPLLESLGAQEVEVVR